MLTAMYTMFMACVGFMSLVAVFIGGSGLRAVLRFATTATRTATGEVIRIERDDSGEGVFWYPVVEFHAEDQRWEVRTRTGYSRPTHVVGEKVVVHYPEGRPDDAQLDLWEGLSFSLGLLVCGAVFFAGAIRGVLRGDWR